MIVGIHPSRRLWRRAYKTLAMTHVTRVLVGDDSVLIVFFIGRRSRKIWPESGGDLPANGEEVIGNSDAGHPLPSLLIH